MRGLDPVEREVLEAAALPAGLEPTGADGEVYSSAQQLASDRMVRRGLVVERSFMSDSWEWVEDVIAPLGRLALLCDIAARAGVPSTVTPTCRRTIRQR